jgi:hypothetical protein
MVSVFLMLMGSRLRGQMSGSYGKGKGAFKGPVWFLFMVMEFYLL